MGNEAIKRGEQIVGRLHMDNGVGNHIGGKGITDSSDCLALYDRYKYVLDTVVNAYYNAYKDCVDKCDLYSQAHLTFMELFSAGWFDTPKKPSYAARLTDRLQTSLHKYCVEEMHYHDNTDAMQVFMLTNVDDRDLLFGIIHSELDACINTLTDREIKFLKAYYYDGRKLSDIADEAGLSLATVSFVVAQAIRKLRHPSRSRKLSTAWNCF